jgi:hypothetical protein
LAGRINVPEENVWPEPRPWNGEKGVVWLVARRDYYKRNRTVWVQPTEEEAHHAT